MRIPKYRSVLIVGEVEPELNLRVGGMKRKKKKSKVTTLLYQELDDQDQLINQFWMYNLEDVSIFFKQFLETEVCYGSCEGSDDDKKKSESATEGAAT